MINIKLTTELKKEEAATTTKELTVIRMTDSPHLRKVTAVCKETLEPIVLWSGDEYDNIGQWTDDDVEARLRELYSSYL